MLVFVMRSLTGTTHSTVLYPLQKLSSFILMGAFNWLARLTKVIQG
jgi:hypothetical protein